MTIKNAVVLIELEEVEGTRAVVLEDEAHEWLISFLHSVATPLQVTEDTYDTIKFIDTKKVE